MTFPAASDRRLQFVPNWNGMTTPVTSTCSDTNGVRVFPSLVGIMFVFNLSSVSGRMPISSFFNDSLDSSRELDGDHRGSPGRGQMGFGPVNCPIPGLSFSKYGPT